MKQLFINFNIHHSTQFYKTKKVSENSQIECSSGSSNRISNILITVSSPTAHNATSSILQSYVIVQQHDFFWCLLITSGKSGCRMLCVEIVDGIKSPPPPFCRIVNSVVPELAENHKLWKESISRVRKLCKKVTWTMQQIYFYRTVFKSNAFSSPVIRIWFHNYYKHPLIHENFVILNYHLI